MRTRPRRRRRMQLESLQGRELLDAAGIQVSDDHFELRQGSPAAVLDLLANDRIGAEYSGAGQITSTSFGSRGGLIRIAQDGQSVEYELPADFAGTETFEYYIDYEHRGTVSIEIDSPLQEDLVRVTPDQQDVTIDVLANDRLWNDYTGAGRITAVSQTRLGGDIRVADDGSGIIYTPPEYQTGKDVFVYFVDDIFSAVAEVTIVDPLAEDRVFGLINETGIKQIDVLANDPFFAGYNGAGRITQILDYGGLGLDDDTPFSIAPDGLSIEVNTDGRRTESTATHWLRYVVDNRYSAELTVRLNSPVQDDHLGSIRNTSAARPLDVLANDLVEYPDERYGANDPRRAVKLDLADRITGVSAPVLGGVVEISADGQRLLYTPPAGLTGRESFEYTVDDVYVARVTFYVIDPPQGGGSGGGGGGGGTGWQEPRTTFCRPDSDALNLNQNDGPTTIDVLANDFVQGTFSCDPYLGPRLITEIVPARNGTVSISPDGGTVTYTPDEDFFGSDRFRYVVDDFLSAVVRVNVVRRVRDDQFRVAPDSAENELNVTGNDLFGADYKGPGLVTAVLASQQQATITIAEDRQTILYTPPADFVGEDHFQYVVDGQLKAGVAVFVSPSKDDLLGRRDAAAFWDALLAEAIETHADRFGQALEDFATYPDVFWTAHNNAVWLETSAVADSTAFATRANVFSETNVQVAGVDEADLIETDGEHLYVLRENELIVTRAWPASELEVVSRLTIEGRPLGMYWDDDRLAIISRPPQPPPPAWYYGVDDLILPSRLELPGVVASDHLIWAPPYPQPWPARETIVTMVDIEQPAEPRVVHTTHLDGDYVESRRIDDSVFLVLRNAPVRLPGPARVHEVITADGSLLVYRDGESPADIASIREAARSTRSRYETSEEYISRVTPLMSDMLPSFESFLGDGSLARAGLIVAPGDFYEPLGIQNRGVLTVASLNMQLDEPGITGSTAVFTSGSDDIYASADSLYVMDRAYNQEDGRITKILKFDWNGASGEIDFVARGQVAGYTLDQFAMDEFDGHFRIATTLGNSGAGNHSGNSENAIWVLDDRGGLLEIVGDLQNVGLTEHIKSVRFMGERAFVTTFREIDPLFVLDLSDHRAPTRVGYVTLPGYNSYMQPVDADHLLTVGHNGITPGIGSTQVLLFDVSDITRPRIVGRHSFYLDSTSIAEQEHHAFGWFAHHGVLAIPLVHSVKERIDSDRDGYRESWRRHREDQLAVLEVDVTATVESRDGIRLRGTVEHHSAVTRSAFINDVLYSIAHDEIIAAEIDDPANLISRVNISPPEPTGPVDEAREPTAVERRNDALRGRIARAREAAIDHLGETLTPPILFTMESSAEHSASQFVFSAGGQQLLVAVDANEDAAVVTSRFQFDQPVRNRHQNPEQPRDVNGDGYVTSFDVLRIANEINAHGPHALSDGHIVRQIGSLADAATGDFLDVNGDGIVSAMDALMTVNWINEHGSTSVFTGPAEDPSDVAEGEAGPARPVARQDVDRVWEDGLDDLLPVPTGAEEERSRRPSGPVRAQAAEDDFFADYLP